MDFLKKNLCFLNKQLQLDYKSVYLPMFQEKLTYYIFPQNLKGNWLGIVDMN